MPSRRGWSKRAARVAAVVAAGTGAGSSPAPTASARSRSKPTRWSSSVSCTTAHAIPEEPRMRRTVTVLGPAGQVRALHRLTGAAALHRRGVHHPHVVAPQRSIGSQQPYQVHDQAGRRTKTPVVPGLLGQVRKQMPQVSRRVTQPAPLRDEPEQRRHHSERHQLGITERRREADPWTCWRHRRRGLQSVVNLHVEYGCEGVQVRRHTRILDALASCPQASPSHHSSRPTESASCGSRSTTSVRRPASASGCTSR
jgi:hypothetical protein